MLTNSNAIKNLSIAYEALAHASGVEDLQERIQFLLTAEITRAENRVKEQDEAPKRIDDNEIPF